MNERNFDLTFVLKELYVREINCGLSSFWDGGWNVWIGDDLNGIRAKTTIDGDNEHLIGQWLAEAADVHFCQGRFSWEIGVCEVYRSEHSQRTRPLGNPQLVESPSHD